MSSTKSLPCPKCGAAIELQRGIILKQPFDEFCKSCNTKLKCAYLPEHVFNHIIAVAVSLAIMYANYRLFRGTKAFVFLCLLAMLAANYAATIVRSLFHQLCRIGFTISEDNSKWQFSLIQAIYTMLILAVMVAFFTGRMRDDTDGGLLLCGGLLMWLAIEIARYISIKRGQIKC